MNDNFVQTFAATGLDGAAGLPAGQATASRPASSMPRAKRRYIERLDATFAAFAGRAGLSRTHRVKSLACRRAPGGLFLSIPGPCRGPPCTKTSWPRSRPPVLFIPAFSQPRRKPTRSRSASSMSRPSPTPAGCASTTRAARPSRPRSAGKVKTTFVENVPEGADAERVIRDLAQQGHKLIFTPSFGYMEPTLKVAQRLPGREVRVHHRLQDRAQRRRPPTRATTRAATWPASRRAA